jgi:cytochrome c-type biogenesis protein CcmF
VPNATAADLGVARGDRVVARGVVLHDYVPEAEAVVLTGAAGVGTPRALPQGVDPTRVTVRAARVTVSDDDGRVMTGTVGQRRYRAQGGMQVRDVAVDRGPLRDTYVIAGLSDGTASVTVKRIPFMTPLRVAVLLLLGGMSLVALFDPRHGVWRREFVAGLRPEAVPDGDREVRSD